MNLYDHVKQGMLNDHYRREAQRDAAWLRRKQQEEFVNNHDILDWDAIENRSN